ncbi:T9SS type A sorting domain-containing protein [Fibrella sp. WM1]|uniref:T9SS type A sorting domain-containing protein n=1 Tax=Fibrella musci TaxID=3242485 RepID=UPI00352148B6
MRTLYGFLVALLVGPAAFATHILGGYIRTVPVPGQASTQRITVTMYYNRVEGAAPADVAQTLPVCFGDGSAVDIYRTSSQRITTSDVAGIISMDQYTVTHTYSGPGVYQLRASTSNRNNNIRNINNGQSSSLNFAIQAIVQVGIANQMPVLAFPVSGLVVALNQPVSLSLAATDADCDSLSYGLAVPTSSLEPGSEPTRFCSSFSVVTGYQFPNDVRKVGAYRLNPRTGQLNWNVPIEQGRYSAVILVFEWRAGVLISQAQQELMLIVIDRGGTPVPPPAYEPARLEPLNTITALSVDAVNLDLRVAPNPVTNGLVQIELMTALPKPVTLALLDSQGRVYQSVELKQAAEIRRHAFDISGLAAGTYLIRAESNGQQVVKKVVKP